SGRHDSSQDPAARSRPHGPRRGRPSLTDTKTSGVSAMLIEFLSRRPTETRVAVAVGVLLLVCGVQSPGAQESRPESSSNDIPERYRRQVAPMPSTYWRAPDLRDYTRVLKSTEAPPIDANKRYQLPELIDLAQRVNPETRVA